MIGIYKITNNINGKFYVGQSIDIQRRFLEHKTQKNSRIILDKAIQKYGAENFSLEVLEKCSKEQLNEKEQYWILKLNAIEKGYNLSLGGNQQSIGENNGRARLTEQDVIRIRQAYNNHEKQREVYKEFQDKTTFNNFQSVWQGLTWKHIMPEVFTEENKKYYIYENSRGGKGSSAIFTDEEVVMLRQRYVNENAKEIYKDYENIVAYNTLQQILWGRTYSHLPIYKKKEKKWINI